MKTNRRRFLSLLGVSTAAAPLAAKAALDESIAKQAGLSVFGAPGFAGGVGQPASQGNVGAQPYISYEEAVHGAVGYIKTFGLPEFMERDLRRNCRWVGGLDPDIACKRSWSMSVKLQEQRQRNYERMLEDYQNQSWRLKKKSIIQNLLGFDWPWG
jgi:hypothetical protein